MKGEVEREEGEKLLTQSFRKTLESPHLFWLLVLLRNFLLVAFFFFFFAVFSSSFSLVFSLFFFFQLAFLPLCWFGFPILAFVISFRSGVASLNLHMKETGHA